GPVVPAVRDVVATVAEAEIRRTPPADAGVRSRRRPAVALVGDAEAAGLETKQLLSPVRRRTTGRGRVGRRRADVEVRGPRVHDGDDVGGDVGAARVAARAERRVLGVDAEGIIRHGHLPAPAIVRAPADDEVTGHADRLLEPLTL